MSLKDDIERALEIPVRLRAGAPGSLTIRVDGEPIFSKKEMGRSPRSDEIIELIRARTPSSD